MTHKERFSLFNDALVDIERAMGSAYPAAKPLIVFARAAIQTGGRFYLPNSKSVLEAGR